MKRGMSRGNRIMSQGQSQRSQGSGISPFVSDYGLQDIDMELELLKRKREIIEKQQLMLSNSFIQRNDFESSFNERQSYNDRSYDDSPSYGGGPRKRNIPVWDNEPPVKRFSSPSRSGPSSNRGGPSTSRGGPSSRRGGLRSSRGSGRGSAPGRAGPRGSASSRGGSASARGSSKPLSSRHDSPPSQRSQSFRRPNPPPKRNDFNPSKVSKKSSSSLPSLMSLKSCPPAQLKGLVEKSGGLTTRVKPRKRNGPYEDEAFVLRSDSVPSRAVTGRLELALGSILKDLKLANPEYEEIFASFASQRAMKQLLRERIKTAMIGKTVGHPDTIKSIYEELYPKSTDIIMKGLEARNDMTFVPIPSDNPEAYFKKNMRRLFILKMEQMFQKMEEIGRSQGGYAKQYERKRGIPRYAQHKRVAENSQSESATDLDQSKTDPDQSKTDLDQSKTDPDQSKTDPDQNKTDEDVVMTDVSAEAKTDDGKDPNEETNEKSTSDETKESIADVPTENVNESVETKVSEDKKETTETTESTTDKALESTTDKSLESKTDVKKDKQENTDKPKSTENEIKRYEDDIISTEKYLAYDRFLSAKVPHMLKKLAPKILSLLEIDSMYRKIEASIREETRKKLGGTSKPETNQDKPPVKREPLGPLPYFVKLMGKPNLPKRKAMESFFEQYKPRIIKKHRTIHNLLFVGFADKEPFDAILAANGTVIGRFTLDIMVSERNFKKETNPQNKDAPNTSVQEKNTSTNGDETKGTEDSLNESSDRLISSDLDEQISDLLSSIRNADDNTSDKVAADKAGQDSNMETEGAEANESEAQEAKEENKDLSSEIIKDMLTEIKGDETENDEQTDTKYEDITENIDENEGTDQNNGENETAGENIGENEAASENGGENEGENEKDIEEKKDTVSKLKPKPATPATPTRSSARLTRRTSTMQ